MTFDAATSLETLKTRLREFAHPRADPPAARAALERALGSAQLALSRFTPDEHRETLYGDRLVHVELAKETLRTAPTRR